MSPESDKPAEKREPQKFNFTLAVVVGQVGCLTLLIVLAALFGGIWLDRYLDTQPILTIGLVIISIPVTIVVTLFVVKMATSRLRTDSNNDSSQI